MRINKQLLYLLGGMFLLLILVGSLGGDLGNSAGPSTRQSATSLQEVGGRVMSFIQSLSPSAAVTSGGHPNHGAPCDKHIFKYFYAPRLTLSHKRAPTQFLGADYDIRNDPWPPDPSVATGFYRIESNGRRVIHSAPTPNGFEERWTLKHDRTVSKATAWMLGYYDCDGKPTGQSSQVWNGEIFDADVTVVGTRQVTQKVSGTFADMRDSGGTRIIVVRPFGGGTNIYGFAIYGNSGQYDHFTGVLRIPSLSYLTPSAGPVGTEVTASGFGFTPVNNRLEFDRNAIGYLPSADGKTLTFTIPSQITIGVPCAPDAACPPPPSRPVELGDHEISVINSNGASNTLIFTVKE